MQVQGEKKLIGEYRINHGAQTWEASSDTEMEVQNAFHGHVHQTQGYTDWAYNHNRLCDPGNSKFHIEFSLPDCVKNSSNEVDLSVAYFAPWNMSPSSVNIIVNGHELVHHDQVKGEH